MDVLETVQTINLTKTSDGTIRIGKTRVSLESVVHHFSLGATAEEIAQKFPALKLAEVYGAISYFLNNHEKVGEYVLRQEEESDRFQTEIESKFQISELRQRILARRESRQTALKP
jgi:uncharacterized protein (DUF433 family)